jgi:outer membrane protein OmpA-like peptidoglycan-associated protein
MFVRFLSLKKVYPLVLLLFFCSTALFAGDEGYIEIYLIATKQGDNTAIEGATVKVFSNDQVIQTELTSKKGKAKLTLKYGLKYRLELSKAGFVTSYFLLDGTIPHKKHIVISGFQQNVFFVESNNPSVDTARFRHPFTKWEYDVKEDRFKEDEAYLKDFEAGIFKEDIEAENALAAKEALEKAERDRLATERKRHEALRADLKRKVHIAGKVMTCGKTCKPVMHARLALVNAQGKAVETTTTNALGSFAFARVTGEENFVVEIEYINPKYLPDGAKIAITNKDGKQILIASNDGQGKFRFQFLASDKSMIEDMAVKDTDLKVDIRGKLMKGEKSPMALLKINLLDDKGTIVQSALTDVAGKFRFRNLASDAYYVFGIDESDTQLKDGEKLILTDDMGQVVKEMVKEPKHGFKFEILPSDQTGLTLIYEDDPWLKVIDPLKTKGETEHSLVIKEHVYFKSNDASLQPEALPLLDEVISVMENVPNIRIELSSHTDSKGSDEYNLSLSQKRAKAAVDYIVSHGITADRISGKGFGETQLVNKCANGVECTEEEHAQNRRLEFKVLNN